MSMMQTIGATTSNVADDSSLVVLLHGLGRTRRAMAALDRHLRYHGFRTVNLGYPSRSLDIRQIANAHLAPAVSRLIGTSGRPVHFVGHSLGSIVVRQYLRDHPVTTGTRVVMLAPLPPLTGGMASVADNLGRSALRRKCHLTLNNNGKATPGGRRAL